MLLEIFFDGFLGFADVNGQKEQAVAGKIMTDLVHEVRFVGALTAPGGPEFQQNDFPFDGVVGEFFAAGCDGVESRCGLFVLGSGHKSDGSEEQCRSECYPQENSSGPHEENVSQPKRTDADRFVGTIRRPWRWVRKKSKGKSAVYSAACQFPSRPSGS